MRWWDGHSWSEVTAPFPAAPATGSGLVPPIDWLRQSIRLAITRAGHFFPMVVALLVPAVLANGLSLWWALHEAVLVIDEDGGTVTSFSNPSGSPLSWLAVTVTTVLVVVATVYLGLAVVRQVEAHLGEQPEPWSTSMRAALVRLPRAVPVTLVFIGAGVGLFAVLTVGELVAPGLGVLAMLVWAIGSLVVVVRSSLAIAAAALAPSGAGVIAVSWALSGSRFWALFGRLVLLALVSASVALLGQFVSAPFMAIAGGTAGEPFDPTASEFRFGELFGPNPAVFGIGQLFSALANGAIVVIWAAGLALIYRQLAGPTSLAVVADDATGQPAVASPGPTSPGSGTSGADDGR